VVKCVEVPKWSRNKYEYDPGCGGIKLDAISRRPSSTRLTMGSSPTRSRPIGFAITMQPIDNTIVCVPCDDPGWNELGQVDELPRQLRDEIAHFFSTYKDLEPDRRSIVHGWADRDAAEREIEQARARCREAPRS